MFEVRLASDRDQGRDWHIEVLWTGHGSEKVEGVPFVSGKAGTAGPARGRDRGDNCQDVCSGVAQQVQDEALGESVFWAEAAEHLGASADDPEGGLRSDSGMIRQPPLARARWRNTIQCRASSIACKRDGPSMSGMRASLASSVLQSQEWDRDLSRYQERKTFR